MSLRRIFTYGLLAAFAWMHAISYALQSGLLTPVLAPLLAYKETHLLQVELMRQRQSARSAKVDYLILGDADFQSRVKRNGNVVRIAPPRMNLMHAKAVLEASKSFPATHLVIQNRAEFWSDSVMYGVQPNLLLWEIAIGKGYEFQWWPIQDVRSLFDLLADMTSIPRKAEAVSVIPYAINQEWSFRKKLLEHFKAVPGAKNATWLADLTRLPTDNQYGLFETFRIEMGGGRYLEQLGTFTAEGY